MRHGRHIERRNPRRSPYLNNQDVCQQCGRTTYKFRLVPQFSQKRGSWILVDRHHPGCLDTLDTYQGPIQRGPHYGGT